MSAWYIAALAAPIWLAVIILVIVLATPVRQQARQNPALRNRVTGIIGAACLLILYLCATAFVSGISAAVAEFYWRYNQLYEKHISAEDLPNLDAAYRELLLREILPLHPQCITNTAACTQADELIHFARSNAQPGESASGGSLSLIAILISITFALIEVGIFRFLTRPARRLPSEEVSGAGQV
jgi:hypothetical protein